MTKRLLQTFFLGTCAISLLVILAAPFFLAEILWDRHHAVARSAADAPVPCENEIIRKAGGV